MSIGKEIIAAIQQQSSKDRRVKVQIPYTNHVVYVRVVEADQFKHLLRAMSPVETRGDEGRAEALAAIHLCVDEDGNPVWTKEDLPALMKFPIAVLRKIWRIGQDINGLSDAAQEDLKGNSEETPPDASS